MTRMYWSTDDGALFLAEHLDEDTMNNPIYYLQYDVADQVVLTPKQISESAGCSASVLEVLLATKQAKRVKK